MSHRAGGRGHPARNSSRLLRAAPSHVERDRTTIWAALTSTTPHPRRALLEDLADWQDEFDNHGAFEPGTDTEWNRRISKGRMLFRRVHKEPGLAMDLQVVNGFEEVLIEGD